jgi:hypothetical protein
MSRGPGRRQRLLLHELYHNPKIGFHGRHYIKVRDYASNGSELSALYRAAREVQAKGWAAEDGNGGHLYALPETPTVAANCPLCQVDKCSQIRIMRPICEHLGGDAA